MFNLYGSSFKYNGIPFDGTNEYGLNLIFVNINTERFDGLYGNLSSEYGVVSKRRSGSRYLESDRFRADPISFDVEIITNDGSVLSKDDVSYINNVLLDTPDFHKLYIIDPSDDSSNSSEKEVYMNCRFSNPENILSGAGVIGYKVTLESDSWLLREEETHLSTGNMNNLPGVTLESLGKQSLTSLGDSVTVTVDSDIDVDIPAEITVRFASGVTTAKISLDGQEACFKSNSLGSIGGTTITINSETNSISPQSYYYLTAPPFKFIKLKNGNNTIQTQGIVGMRIKFNNLRTF